MNELFNVPRRQMNSNDRVIIREYTVELENIIDLENLKTHLKNSKIFTRSMLDDIYECKKSLFEELPSRGPEAFKKFVLVLKHASYNDIAERLNRRQYCDPKNINRCRWTRGHCLIINNVNVPDNMRRRSNIEADALANFFSGIWGSPEFVNTKNVSDMLIFEEFLKKDFSQVDLCVVIILSHGGKKQNCNVIYGDDGKTAYEHDIFDAFSKNKPKHLSNIPKLFLLPSDATVKYSYEKVPNFNDMYLVRWPDKVETDKLFGKVLADCFTDHFNELSDLNTETIDLKNIVERAYKLFYQTEIS